CMQALDFPYSF
nr:immunoglobulin light chain junction region [Macaca mulatta]MOV78095.1 immunoglobulin light chain junction region [Macaca mulatta]MOV78135.1 immunoglobulin light chain junction region [Macaca mulatta]MOV78242.1 immunoglobulin light chain junction region [Macaca mulatta]MOV78459.1 immunoglobulin light chain junction region [Macaca mulatta]